MVNGSSSGPKKSWRDWLGLRAPAPDPNDWVLATSARVDNAETSHSKGAARAAQALEHAGLEVQQRPYVLPDETGFNRAAGGFSPSGVDRIRIAVLVHRRDLERATAVLHPHDGERDPVQK
jgi:hypothetical protein